MRFFRHILVHLRIEEVIVLICAVILLPTNFVLFGFPEVGAMINEFGRLFFQLGSAYEIFVLSLYAVLFAGVYKVIVTSVFDILSKKPLQKDQVKDLIQKSIEPLRIILTLGLFISTFYILFGNLNVYFAGTQQDYLLLKLDNAVFGLSPFLTLPHIVSNIFLHNLLWYSYSGLAVLINAALIITFFVSKYAFRITILSFIIAFPLAFPIFISIPCQDPTNFFVTNIHGYDFPADVDTMLTERQASPVLSSRIQAMSDFEVGEDNVVPISCMPSMHTVWALVSLYTLAMVSIWSLAFSLPFTILTLTGGLYLAQHYAIDYIVSIPVTLICIVLAHLLLKLETRLKEKWSAQ